MMLTEIKQKHQQQERQLRTMALSKEKLKRLRSGHPDWDEERLAGVVDKLTSKEKMLEEFHSLLEVGETAVSETREDRERFGETLEHTVELEKACRRVEERFNPLANFKVVIFLKDLRGNWMKRQITRAVARLSDLLQYGPHQVAIAVGDKVLEWDQRGLVVPRDLDTVEWEERPKFVARVHNKGAYYEKAEAGLTKVMGTVARRIDYAQQEEVVTDMASHREKLVKQVVEVIVRYNTQYKYSTLCRSSQHFVQDVLEALEITEPPDFTERSELGVQFARLKKGRHLIPEYTHQELDEYVEGNFGELTASKDKLEYICNMYAHFHLNQQRRGGLEDKGECHEESCKYDQLKALIFDETIKLSTNLSGATP